MLCKDIFDTYWELANFFEDPWAVYPPPQKESDTAVDIFVLFCNFLTDVAAVSKDVDKLGLRKEIADAQPTSSDPPPVATDPPATVTTTTPAGSDPAVQRAPSNEPRPSLPPQASVPVQGSSKRAPSPFSAALSSGSRAPSPGPQVARSSVDLDATALRRLRTVSGSALSGSTTAVVKAAPVRKATIVDDEDNDQSDVSDWEDSPP